VIPAPPARPATGNGGSIRAHARSVNSDESHPRGRRSTGSATDAVMDVCGLRRVNHPNDLQLDARRQHLEQPTATADGWCISLLTSLGLLQRQQ
jgi:hypothetical protein